MLSEAAIYRKSEKGQRELAERLYGLGVKQRGMLILVNGTRDWGELRKISYGIGDMPKLMEFLLENGFIEPIDALATLPVARESSANAAQPATSATPTSVTSPMPAPTVPNVTPSELAAMRRRLSRRMTDLLGPGVADICIAIESAPSAVALREQAQKALSVVQRLKPAQAEAFAAFLRETLP